MHKSILSQYWANNAEHEVLKAERDDFRTQLVLLQGQRDALKAEAAKWQSLYLAAVDELATVTAELEPWREMSRQIEEMRDLHDYFFGASYKKSLVGVGYYEVRFRCVFGMTRKTIFGFGKTLPEAVSAAYAEVVCDE